MVQFQLSALTKQIEMINKVLKLFVFIPVIFYFGKRSYIAFDEGFYALQARWILDKGNWTIPLWWDEYVLDRTIGLQFLIAKSQDLFGKFTSLSNKNTFTNPFYYYFWNIPITFLPWSVFAIVGTIRNMFESNP